MRASRLLSILTLLQLRECVTADELALQLEVSVRTIYRDVDALCEAGIPVQSERGRGGGFQLTGGYRTSVVPEGRSVRSIWKRCMLPLGFMLSTSVRDSLPSSEIATTR